MITIVPHETPDVFLDASGAFLEKRETENNLLLGISRALKADPTRYGSSGAFFWTILSDGAPTGAAMITPPRRIILSRMDGDIALATARLSDKLSTDGITPPGVVGPSDEADSFGRAWKSSHPSVGLQSNREMRVFEARSVVDLPVATGHLRGALASDQEILRQWAGAFSEAVGEPEIDARFTAENVARSIEESVLYVWDDDGPASMAKYRPTEHGATVSLVYTPSECRCRGYATSCVAELTRKLLAEGNAFCNLFTDLANPTSNSIYTKIGYKALGDWVEFDFVSG